MNRDRERTENRLIDATIELIREKGFSKLGINGVAERAGLSKVLIYRYFDGFNGLLEAVAERLDFTKTSFMKMEFAKKQEIEKADVFFHRLLQDFHKAIQKDELMQHLMIQELQEVNELTQTFARARERQGLEVTHRFESLFGNANLDVEALLALISAGIYYLTLRSRTVQMFNGIDIQSEEGWDRIFSTLTTLMTAILQDSPSK